MKRVLYNSIYYCAYLSPAMSHALRSIPKSLKMVRHTADFSGTILDREGLGKPSRSWKHRITGELEARVHDVDVAIGRLGLGRCMG